METVQAITVAVAENDQNKREQLEHFLRQSDHTIRVVTDTYSFYDKKIERRLKSREGLSIISNTVARIKRLKPRVLFVNIQQLTKESFDLLAELNQYCPDTLPIVLVKEETNDRHILKALENGARGIVNCSTTSLNVTRIIHTVDKGEPWVSRRILTKIMQKLLFTSH